MTFALLLRVMQSVDSMTAAANDLWQVSDRLEVCLFHSLRCQRVYATYLFLVGQVEMTKYGIRIVLSPYLEAYHQGNDSPLPKLKVSAQLSMYLRTSL